MRFRYIAAATIGVVFDLIFFWLPYDVFHSESAGLSRWWLAAFAFLAGFWLTMRLEDRAQRIALAILGGCAGANAVVIAVDLVRDPTSHSLWPFEFVLIAVLVSPAFLGAHLGSEL